MQWRFPEGLAFAGVLVALLITGLWSLQLIPVYEPLRGLDFQNTYAYQTCPEVRESGLYSVSGAVCGDVGGRSFAYPPAMFHSFFWVEWFGFEDALAIWTFAMVAAMFALGAVWLWLDGRLRSGWQTGVLVVVWLLLFVQFPFVFAVERANNDIVPLLLWTGAAALFIRQRYTLSGAFSGLAIASKVYPVLAFAIVALGAVRRRSRIGPRLVLGCLVGGLLASMLWWDETIRYFTEVLPAFAGTPTGLAEYSHPLRSLSPPLAGYSLALLLFASWGVAAWKRLERKPLLVYAGALAISTYFSATSYDYNHITTYPLLLLAAARALDHRSSSAWKVATLVSVFAVASGRGLLTPSVQLFVQVAALSLLGLLVAVTDEDGTPLPQLPAIA